MFLDKVRIFAACLNVGMGKHTHNYHSQCGNETMRLALGQPVVKP